MSADFFRKTPSCRICASARLSPVVDLGVQALGSIFPEAGEPDPPKIPLELVRCENCALVQLAHTVVADAMYTYGYGYRSGLTATMRGHLAGLADWVRARCSLNAGDSVLDIGCNDGTLLKAYGAAAGLRRFGIDAVAGKFRDEYPPDIHLHEGYFDAETYAAVLGDARCKAITSISMFYDLPAPNEFVAAIKKALAPDGIWVLEQSYLATMLDANSYDTVCHEHLEYYALRQIEHMAAANGLRVFDAELNDCNGGSIRLAVCHEDGPQALNEAAVGPIKRREAALGLDTAAPYEAFAGRIERSRAELTEFIDRERAAGKTFYLYGASTKGNTLLQYCGLDRTRIVAAAERNPEKFGCRTPGSNIPIVSEAEMRAAKPDYLLVLPWHFRDEFVKREADFLAKGGKLIFPLPRFEIVSA
ncbi:MAG: class I SAM-dependent methyltransferase [Proteobacteria bacterium]|nr:class I SAM-dependent methyltransferase [Pseudomonadota bacterium]